MKRLFLILALAFTRCTPCYAQTLPTPKTKTVSVNASTNALVNPTAAQLITGNPSLGLPSMTGNAGKLLSTNGTTSVWISAGAGTGDALVANPLSQFASTTSAQLAGVVSNETGSGLLVFGTSPTITTPIISGAITLPDGVRQTFNPNGTTPGLNFGATDGAPSSLSDGDVWYDTGTGFFNGRADGATGVFALTSYHLGNFGATTSAQLRGVLSDETGTGAAVFAGGNIGAATATSVNGLTITTSSGTLTIANSKTLTVSNTLTFTGTDGSTLNIGTGGTLGTAAYTAATAYQAADADLTTYAGITPSANVQSVLGAANYAAIKTLLSLDLVENTALSTWGGSANITTVGTLGSLTVSGATSLPSTITFPTNTLSLPLVAATFASLAGDGSLVTALNATSLASGTVANARLDADLQTFAGITPGTGVATALAVATNAAGGFSPIDGTATLSNKTIDGASNVLKLKGYIYLTHPHLADGTGATIGTTATAIDYGHATFSNSADKAANYVEYYIQVPEDMDTSVALRARLKVRLTAADTNDQNWLISSVSVADSAVPTSATLANEIALDYTADASGATGDIETTAWTTLTSWAGALTAGQTWRIRLMRDGDTSDASTVNSTEQGLVIEYGISQ